MNFQVKVLTHVFTWSYHHPQEKPISVSHLCGRARCCRPSHLHSEPMPVNNSRSGCVGYIRKGNQYYLVCEHNPACLKIIVLHQSMKVDDPTNS
jgi:hypothetical protein